MLFYSPNTVFGHHVSPYTLFLSLESCFSSALYLANPTYRPKGHSSSSRNNSSINNSFDLMSPYYAPTRHRTARSFTFSIFITLEGRY